MGLNRRRFLQGLGATGASLTFAGFASAGGASQYVAVGGSERRFERAGFAVDQVLAEGSVFVLSGPSDALSDLRNVGGVQTVERNVRFTLERPRFERSAETSDVEPTTLYDDYLWDKQLTRSVEANQIATGEGSKIAIIDTGSDYMHPDLAPTLDEDAGRRFKNGSIDSGTEADIVVGRPTSPDSDLDFDIAFVKQHVADDVEGHGTHVAGIAAASDEQGATGTGVLGTAPRADFAPFRVFWWIKTGDDSDPVDERWEPTTTTADILTAIDYAAENGYDAANLSLGTPPLPPQANSEPFVRAYKQVIQSAVARGTVVAASAGNAATDLQRRGVFTLPNSVSGAMSISATAPNDALAFYSNYGTSEIDVGAPGGAYETLEKTLATDTEWPYPTNLVFSTISPRVEGGAYGWKAGTSMAAPQVAGLVALVRELAPDASTRKVESLIKQGADGATGRSDPDLGAGRIDALDTVELADSPGAGRGGGGNGGGRP
jgi:subtilisin family serine protease